MKQKILHIIWIILFCCIFWFFYGQEYWNFREEKESQKIYQNTITQNILEFSFDEIVSFWDEIELLYTPYLWLLDRLVEEIDSAEEKIYVEVYIFTETRLRDALIAAHERWVDVKILLENNPYQAPYLNDKHYKAFLDAWIDITWSDPLNYSLNHSKLLIIDEKAYVSTWNFSYSLFKYNRDFIVSLRETEIVNTLEELFLFDFSHNKKWVYHENLVLSPDYARDKLSNLVQSAQKNIDFYFPYIADDDFEELLFNMADSGIQIRWIVEEKFYKENHDVIKKYKDNNIELTALDGNKLHGKAILVDEKYLYVGSINFSRYSFDENREIWILVNDNNIISKFKKVFDSDL